MAFNKFIIITVVLIGISLRQSAQKDQNIDQNMNQNLDQNIEKNIDKSGDLEYYVNGESVVIKVTETGPDQYPRINLSNGLSFYGTPHFYINVMSRFDGYFRITERISSDINYAFLFGPWKEYFLREFVGGYNNEQEERPYTNFQLKMNYRFFRKETNANIPIFYSQKSSFTRNSFTEYAYREKEYTNLIVPAKYMKYLEMSAGYFHYNDILADFDQEFLQVYSTAGTKFDDVFLNYDNRILQFGLIYGRTAFIKAESGKRKLRKIESTRFYFHILYSNGALIEDIKDRNTGLLYPIDIHQSGLVERNFGFKVGFEVSNVILFDFIGYKYGFELGQLPSIKGFPDDLGNLYAGFFASYSFHFLKM